MNRTLILTLIRNRLSSPVRLALLVITTLSLMPVAIFSHQLGPIASSAIFFGFIIAAGAIGQDIASGTLQLVLARPVSRPAYVMSRWFATGLLAGAWTVGVLALAYAAIASGPTAPTRVEFLVLAGEGISQAFGGAALVIMFSSLAGGLGDVGLLVGSYIALNILGQVAQHDDWRPVIALVEQLNASYTLHLSLGWIVEHQPPPWMSIMVYVSTVAFALGVAILRLNRRELSYAGNA